MGKRPADNAEQLAIAKATIYQGLEPVDLQRCQGESKENVNSQNAFRHGYAAPVWERCTKASALVVIEPTQDAQRLRGAMALCPTCAKICRVEHPDYLYRPVAPFRAALKLGGHQAVKDMIYGARRRA